MGLGAVIRMIRGKRTREEFAVTIGCSYFTLRRWEIGEAVPRSRAHVRNLLAEGVPAHVLESAGVPASDVEVA
jgi:hypothetical protein